MECGWFGLIGGVGWLDRNVWWYGCVWGADGRWWYRLLRTIRATVQGREAERGRLGAEAS